jgi:hypothetical protein
MSCLHTISHLVLSFVVCICVGAWSVRRHRTVSLMPNSFAQYLFRQNDVEYCSYLIVVKICVLILYVMIVKYIFTS